MFFTSASRRYDRAIPILEKKWINTSHSIEALQTLQQNSLLDTAMYRRGYPWLRDAEGEIEKRGIETKGVAFNIFLFHNFQDPFAYMESK